MSLKSQPTENIKAGLDRAVAALTAYAGPEWRGHSDFDRVAADGTFSAHASDCPFCAYRNARQAYFNALRQSGLERARRVAVWTTSKDYKQSDSTDHLVSHARATRARARDHMRGYDDMTPAQQVEASAALELAEAEYTSLWSAFVFGSVFNLGGERKRLLAEREEADSNFDGQGAEDAASDLWWINTKLEQHPELWRVYGASSHDFS